VRVVVMRNEAMVGDIVCGREAVYIGAHPDCRVALANDDVPPQQAVLYPENDESWIVQQLAPEHPITLNGDPLDDHCPVHEGDELLVAGFTIRLFPAYEEKSTRRTAGMSKAQLERFAQAVLPPGTVVRKGEEPLSLQADQVAAIGRANLAVSGLSMPEELIDGALQVLSANLAPQRAWIGVRRVNYGAMDYVEGRLITGQPIDMPAAAENFKPRVLDRAQFLHVPRLSKEEPLSILCGPLLGPDGTLGMVYIDNGTGGRRFDVRDLDFFIMLLSVIAHQLDAIFKSLARTRAAMVEGQVSVAHEVQMRLTPRKLPQSDALQWGAFREPGRERSGDIYDVVKLPNGLIGFMLAQTPSSGALPSIVMTQAQTAFRYAAMHQDLPELFLRSLNWLLYDGRKDHALRCFIGAINPATGAMRYSIAGRLAAYIVNNRGDERSLLPDEETPELSAAKNSTYPALSEEVAPGETLVLFTPGVTTARNRSGEGFGEQRVVDILCDGFGQHVSATLKDLLADLRGFTEGSSQPDDITVLMAYHA
jgi:serine phosphatase RsbU (regulator of sigma subunit)